jgi:RNA polymerase sigma factor (sigma-70 family)
LTELNMPLAKYMTARLWKHGALKFFESLDDALQEAYKALMNAIQKEDPDHPQASWSNYICECIKRHLLRANKEIGVIHTPAWAFSKKAKKERPEAYRMAKNAHGCASLEFCTIHSTCSALVHVEDPSVGLQVEELLAAIALLPDYERDLIEVSFGLNGETKTLRAYAEEYGISHELARVRQGEVLDKLRERLEGRRCQKEAA